MAGKSLQYPAIILRDETADDFPAIREIHVAAFNGRPGEAGLVDDLRRNGDAVISIVATRQGAVVGHILFSRLEAPMPALSLAPLAVHPDFQRQGIGSALVRAGLDRARETGWSSVFVLGSPAYYGRFGFDLEAARTFACSYSGNHFMALHPGKELPGGGRLVYPKAFKKLD